MSDKYYEVTLVTERHKEKTKKWLGYAKNKEEAKEKSQVMKWGPKELEAKELPEYKQEKLHSNLVVLV